MPNHLFVHCSAALKTVHAVFFSTAEHLLCSSRLCGAGAARSMLARSTILYVATLHATTCSAFAVHAMISLLELALATSSYARAMGQHALPCCGASGLEKGSMIPRACTELGTRGHLEADCLQDVVVEDPGYPI